MSTVFYVISYLTGGWIAARSALIELFSFKINVDLLMVAAAIGAAAVDRWQEGAILMFLFALSGTLESYAMRRTRMAIRALMKLRPKEAVTRKGGREVRVPVESLQVDDIVIIKPGEAISADGIVEIGESHVNQAAITGESIPVSKRVGDSVFAGTLNVRGALDVRVKKAFHDTTLSRIIRLVEEAQEEKTLPQRFSDWFGKYYTLGVLVGSGLYMAWLLGTGLDWDKTFYRSMVLLVAASPCALVMATPSAILSAIANAARRGILVKGGVALEALGRVRVMALDKTGTLTSGRTELTDIIPADGVDEAHLLALAATAECKIDHPLAAAVLSKARERNVHWQIPDEAEVILGMGVRAAVNGTNMWAGTELILSRAGVEIPETWRVRALELQRQGRTYMFVAEESIVGLLGIADTLRPTARAAIQKLARLGVSTVMLTGDAEGIARAVGRSVGIEDVRHGLLPQDKLRIIEELRAEHGEVAMVGDGVNDAPALARATAGVAMGTGGTDVALESADVVLMSDDLEKLVEAVDLSRKTVRVVRQNWYFALTVVLVLIATSLVGNVPLPLAVVGHEGNTLIVVLSGLRLLFYKPRK